MTSVKKKPTHRTTAVLLSALMALATVTPPAGAASHREAPLVALDPAADNTDTYAFRSWQDPSKAVFIMNVIRVRIRPTARTISTSTMKCSTPSVSRTLPPPA